MSWNNLTTSCNFSHENFGKLASVLQLKDMVERIKAVDHAALMVEDIIKQGQCQSLHQVIKPPLSVNSARQVYFISLGLPLGHTFF